MIKTQEAFSNKIINITNGNMFTNQILIRLNISNNYRHYTENTELEAM